MSEAVTNGNANGGASTVSELDESLLQFTPEELIQKLERDMQKRTIENEILKSRVLVLEKELTKHKEAAAANTEGGAVSAPAAQTERKADDLLLKAKELLFEKTKIGKRQEQQIAALNIQVQSLKDVLEVTKDLLNIRNAETSQLEAKMDTMDMRLKAEKEHQLLTTKKLDISKKLYEDLRTEYDCQSKIFKELRQNYEKKNQILTQELKKHGPSTSS